MHTVTVYILIKHCCTLLDSHKAARSADPDPSSPDPELEVLRRYSANTWQETKLAMRAHSSSRVPTWRSITRTWTVLGRALDVDRYLSAEEQAKSDERVVNPLERCNWQDCVCSVFKPIHLVRICQGCRAVAYCNSKCQLK